MLKRKQYTVRFALVICAALTVLALSTALAQNPVVPVGANPRVGADAPQMLAKTTNATIADLPAQPALRIGMGDLLEVSVYGVPELMQKVRVSSAGDIYLPLINYVHVVELTPDEAQALIEKKLVDGGFLRNPHVTVFVSEYVSQSVTLLGEVVKPGTYSIVGDHRLLDVISAAGGPTDKAGKAVTIVHRDHPDTPEVLDLTKSAEGMNPALEPGDTIIVSKAGVVYVVGEVAKPSGFLMENGSLTVLKAIALAGGTTHSAALNNAKIIRKTPGGMEETPIPLKKILAAKAPDLPMEPEDVLFVPGSASKSAAARGIEAVLQTATALSIVAVH